MAALLAACACNRGNNNELPADTLVKVGKTALTRSDLDRVMPGGLNYEDSVKFARAYIRSWMESKIISDIASREVDMANINKMVDEYRNQLIMLEYTRRMYESHSNQAIPEDSIRSYYDEHKSEFVLSQPLVKGVYLKVADDARSLPSIRRLYKSSKQEDIDKLEKSELSGAVHYDYFRDRWVDWEQIESRVPYEFGQADAFLRAHKDLDFSSGGFAYLLNITDVLHTGETMPYDAAKPQIIDRMRFSNRRQYENALKANLYDNAVEDKDVEIFCEL